MFRPEDFVLVDFTGTLKSDEARSAIIEALCHLVNDGGRKKRRRFKGKACEGSVSTGWERGRLGCFSGTLCYVEVDGDGWKFKGQGFVDDSAIEARAAAYASSHGRVN